MKSSGNSLHAMCSVGPQGEVIAAILTVIAAIFILIGNLIDAHTVSKKTSPKKKVEVRLSIWRKNSFSNSSGKGIAPSGLLVVLDLDEATIRSATHRRPLAPTRQIERAANAAEYVPSP